MIEIIGYYTAKGNYYPIKEEKPKDDKSNSAKAVRV